MCVPSFISFSFSPIFLIVHSLHSSLQLRLCLIHFPSLSSFFSLPATLFFSSCLCLHLLITHSVSSSITLSGLPPSHPSFSVGPLTQLSFSFKSFICSVFLQVKHNSLHSFSMHDVPSHACTIPLTLIYHSCPLCLSHRFSSHWDFYPFTSFLQRYMYLRNL